MRILAIETSCDETAITLMEATGEALGPQVNTLGNALFSQAHLHAEYGGVYPNLAKREHQKNLPLLLEKVLKDAQEDTDAPQIDFIAVTSGPGLEPALWTGITFAAELGRKWNKPVIPINHMEGHIYSVLTASNNALEFPAVALLVSGGHTEIVCINDVGRYDILGKTRDDAVGEAFDKVARLLGLPYPGGPQIGALASSHRQRGMEPAFTLPRPMLTSPDLDFSYSGLKTAVLYKLKELGTLTDEQKEEVARAFEDAAIEVLVEKTHRALEKHPEAKTLIVAGGVAANTYLKEKIGDMAHRHPQVSLILPDKALATDNAVMIALAAYARVRNNPSILENPPLDIRADGNLSL